MNEEQFLKTMVETVKYDDYYDNYENKDELIGVLRNSLVKYNATSLFANKSYQFWEDIDLRVPIPMLKIAKKLKKELQRLASEVYIETSDHAFRQLNIKPKPVALDTQEDIQHDVIFNEIKETIIQGIKGAKYTIWIAVAWFTDEEIFNELLLRKNEGLHIRIITSGEDSNRHIMDKLERNFEVVKVQMRGNYLSNRLHDKFCIIDLEYVMHGSYNWSKNAKGNDETWATALDRDFVKKFADEFMRLYAENQS